MTPTKTGGLSTFEWLTLTGVIIGLLGAYTAWALAFFTPRTEFQLVKESLDRIEDRQEGKEVRRPPK